MTDESHSPKTNKQTRRITIGDIVGGIRNSIVAAGDVIIRVDISSLFRGPLRAVGAGLRRHWFPFVTFIVIEAAILSAYLAFRIRFLVPSWQFWFSTALLFLASGSWIAWLESSRRHVVAKVFALVSAVAMVVVLGGSIFHIVWPEKFPPDAYGVVVAHFGEGFDFKPTRIGTDISRAIIEKLEAEAKKTRKLVDIRVDEIGIVKGSGEAKWMGGRVTADLVIWGRLVVGEDAVAVHFEVLETDDSALHPEFPRALPIGYEYSIESTDKSINILSKKEFIVTEIVASQTDAITHFVMGLVFYLDREYQEAINRFEQTKEALDTKRTDWITEETRKTVADPGLVHYYLGKSYQMLGRRQEAVAELEIAADLNDRDPAVQLGLAYSYGSLENTTKAREAALKAIEICEDIDPLRSRVEVQYDLGLAYQMLDQHDDALEAYLWIIEEIDPDFHIAYVSAGRIYALKGDWETAIEKYQKAIKKAKKAGFNGAWAHLDLAYVYLELGDIELALNEYLTAVELEPEQDWMHLRLAQFYEIQGEHDAAWQEYERFEEVSANKAWANAVLGAYLRRQQSFDLAIQCFKRARQYNRDDAMLSLSLGETYLDRYVSPERQDRDAEEAERAFSEALNMLPENSPTRFYVFSSRAHLYFHQQRFDLAIADFVSALEIDPLSAEIQFGLARAYDAAGNVKDACVAYGKVLDPNLKAAEALVSDARDRFEALCSH